MGMHVHKDSFQWNGMAYASTCVAQILCRQSNAGQTQLQRRQYVTFDKHYIRFKLVYLCSRLSKRLPTGLRAQKKALEECWTGPRGELGTHSTGIASIYTSTYQTICGILKVIRTWKFRFNTAVLSIVAALRHDKKCFAVLDRCAGPNYNRSG
jgi:hypothetical protein